MARKLKTYLTTSGFFDLAVAAPSMTAALRLWGSGSNLFHQGFARETDDTEIVAATLAHPGVVLRRPVGSKGVFKERAALPSLASLQKGATSNPAPVRTQKQRTAKSKAKAPDPKSVRKAAQRYAQEKKLRERGATRAAKADEKARRLRHQAERKARAALEAAEARHVARVAAIETHREKLEEKARVENKRWEEERRSLEAARLRARR